MFEGLPYRHFRLIAADPAWDFKSNSKKNPGRNPRRHYGCMSLEDIARLPVEAHAADQAVLLMWIIGPMLVIGAHIPIMRGWGFEPCAMAFDWIKLNPNANRHFFTQSDLHMGPGFTTRKNAEYVVMGKRGLSVREAADIQSVIISPRRDHSQKPEEFYERAARYCSGPRLELFGRTARAGWTVRGDEVGKFQAVV